MITFGAIVYILCFVTSALCVYLMFRAFQRQRQLLLLWSAISFCFLALTNLLVFIDLILLPDIDLMALRSLSSLVAVAVLLYGFIWEIE